MALPLHDIRVLDAHSQRTRRSLSCSFQLALLGAEVIKDRAPGKRGPQPDACWRGRKSGRGTDGHLVRGGQRRENNPSPSTSNRLKERRFSRTLRRFRVFVIENFRPGDHDPPAGLDYPDAFESKSENSTIARFPGFGQGWTAGDLHPAYDQVIQGISGVMRCPTGDAQSAPLRVGYPICDTMGGGSRQPLGHLRGARRFASHRGQGRRIDVSMLESTLASMGWVVSRYRNTGVEPIPYGK